MSHRISPSTTKALKLRQNGSTLRGLAYSLGFDDFMASALSHILRGNPGAVSLETENTVRVALGLEPIARRRYLRPCLSLDPETRMGQLRDLMAKCQLEMTCEWEDALPCLPLHYLASRH